MAPLTEFVQRVGPFVQTAFEDSDVTDRLQRAGAAGREAVLRARTRNAPKRTVARRAGEAVAELGATIVALSKVSPRPRRRRRRLLVPVAVTATVVAVWLQQQGSEESTSGSPTPAA